MIPKVKKMKSKVSILSVLVAVFVLLCLTACNNNTINSQNIPSMNNSDVTEITSVNPNLYLYGKIVAMDDDYYLINEVKDSTENPGFYEKLNNFYKINKTLCAADGVLRLNDIIVIKYSDKVAKDYYWVVSTGHEEIAITN